MPRIPDGLSVRPVPQARLSVATRRNAGAVGSSIAGIGQTVARAGSELWQKQDALAYSAAKSAYISGSEQAKRDFQDDPDYATFDERYSERMKQVREEALKLINTNSDKAIFEAEADVLFERDRSAVLDLARGKRVDAGRALVGDNGDAMLDVVSYATDSGAILSAIGSYNEMVDGAVEQGLYTRQEARALKEQWSASAVQSRINNAISRGALEEAQTVYNELRDTLPWQTRDEVFDRLTKAFQHREDVDFVASLIGQGPTETTVNYADPLRGKGQKPVPGGEYGAKRDYGKHQGVDHPAPAGTNIYAIAAGTVKVSKSEKGGNIVTVTHYDGTVSKYMHLGSVSVKDGDKVTQETVLGGVGSTGRSTGPHLHLEVVDAKGNEVDPETVIGKAASTRQEFDKRNIYAAIEVEGAARGWTPERIENAKREADVQIQRVEGFQSREDDAKVNAALEIVANLGDNFTDTSQIPGFGQLPPRDRITFENIAAQNRKPVEPDANGAVVRSIHRMAIEAPDLFATLDLRPYQAYVTDAEFDELSQSQARARENIGKWSPRSGIQQAITWGEKFGGVELKDDELYRVYRYMEGRAAQWREENGKAPSNREYEGFFTEATKEIKTKDTFLGIDWLNPDETKRAFEFKKPTRDYRALIIRQFRSVNGRDPTEDEIRQWYKKMGEAL